MGDKDRGVGAANQESDPYDQVDKHQEYRLSENQEVDQFDEQLRIRPCDIGRALRGNAEDRRESATELGETLQEIGYAVLENTGIDPGLYHAAAEAMLELLTGTPLEEKSRFLARPHGAVNQGYFAIEETNEIHPDLVEGWVFCRRAFDLDPATPVKLAKDEPVREVDFHTRITRKHYGDDYGG